MANIVFIITATMALQLCINAAPNTDGRPLENVGESTKIEKAEPTLDGAPYEVSETTKVENDKTPLGQRQKRFNDYFDFGLSIYDQYNPYYVKRDESQNTGVYGAQDTMSQILRRLQTIINYTKQKALYPPVTHYPAPSYIPIFLIPHSSCDCIPVAIPNEEESGNDARPTQPKTTPTSDSTTQSIPPANIPDMSPTDNTNNTTPDLSIRLPDVDEEGDGSRPISFIPVKAKTPLSRPLPPVEHGSSQAGIGNNGIGNKVEVAAAPSTTPRPVATGLPPLVDLPTNAIPTLCDGAVLTCCHRVEVTYDCFLSQGCPNPTSPDNPCNESLILRVISKFQYYYANRRLGK